MSNYLKSPLRYPGGKSRIVSILYNKFPVFSEYREPFIGGGSVFLYLMSFKPQLKFWINDLYYDVYNFWIQVKNDGHFLIRHNVTEWKDKFTDGKELFKYLRENYDSFDEVKKASAFFVLNRISFSGTTMSGGFSKDAFEKRFTDSSIIRLATIERWFPCDNTIVTNLDYSALLEAEGEDVFIFMDPPYYTAEKSNLYGKNGSTSKGFDHAKFADDCRKCTHKWLITYDDCDYIRELFKGFDIESISFSYGMKNVSKSSSMKGNEIIIKNY